MIPVEAIADASMDTTMRSSIKTGDRVAYSARFLQATVQHSGSAPFARGTVKRIQGTAWKLATVRWDNDRTSRVHIANLARVGSPEMNAD